MSGNRSEVKRLAKELQTKHDTLELANCRIRDLENELEAALIGKAMVERELEKLRCLKD